MALLDSLPPPLVDDFLRGRWLPVVGAGFSKNAELPANLSVPDWQTLGDALGNQLRHYEPLNALDAISAYAEEYGPTRLVDNLRTLLHVGVAQPGPAHLALCRAGFDLVLTTNFDDLLEAGYREAGQVPQPLLSEGQLAQTPLDGQPQVLKLHGDLDHPDELVATEDHYDGFLQRKPLKATFVANLLITRTPVLLGYSFDDPDTRSLWALIQDRLGKLRRAGYVLRLNPSPTEIARFRRRGINVVTLPGDDYNQVFAQLFEELRELAVKHAARDSTSTEDEVAAQLVLPVDVPSALCYCSVPLQLQGWYRSEIFPLIERAGYVAVTLDEVVAPGSHLKATIQALLQRSQLALIDGTSPQTGFELQAALTTLGAQRLIVVMDRTEPLTPSVRNPLTLNTVEILQRDETTIADPRALAAAIERRLALASPVLSEPEQLLTLGHYGAAVVVAFSRLESVLSRLLEQVRPERKPGAMRLIVAAAEADIVSHEERDRLTPWVGLRNLVVHGNEHPEPDAARRAVADIEAVLNRLGASSGK